jgi:hypothetical protein
MIGGRNEGVLGPIEPARSGKLTQKLADHPEPTVRLINGFIQP